MGRETHPTVDEIEKARRHVNVAFDEAETVLPKGEDYTLSLGWTQEAFVIEQMDGASGHAHAADVIEVDFNTQARTGF